jgi:predicted HTH domain antitoxin
MRVTVELPDEISPRSANPRAELFEAMALRAYSERRISQGRLAALLGKSIWEIEEMLVAKGIMRPYSPADIEEEMTALKKLPK